MSPFREEDYSFACPYCASIISIKVDLSGGSKQDFVYDCEVCCKPIAIHLEQDEDGILSFDAEPES